VERRGCGRPLQAALPGELRPYGKPPRSTHGNVRCLSCFIINGGEAFLNLGQANNGRHQGVFPFPGNVERPCPLEVNSSAFFRETLMMWHRRLRNGRKLKAVSSGGLVDPFAARLRSCSPPTWIPTRSPRAGLLCSGPSLVIVMDETTCMVRASATPVLFLSFENPRQCTPPRRHRLAVSHGPRIEHGRCLGRDLDKRNSLPTTLPGAHCALGDGRPRCGESFIKHFPTSFQYTIDRQMPVTDNTDAHMAKLEIDGRPWKWRTTA